MCSQSVHMTNFTSPHLCHIMFICLYDRIFFLCLDAGMALDLELSITGAEPGKLDHTLFCHVENLADPLPLHVEASVKVNQ